MSAIIGIFDRSGAPVDRALLQAYARFLSYCGPDWRDVWCDGPIGFGHAMLHTTRESQNERQPGSLEGRYWITADARLDCREELEAELKKNERNYSRPATDSDLILQAYAARGAECVQHLRGDFAFAIWDRRQKTLFCARDHFGVKPFYYADLDNSFVFSTVLNCVRLHAGVSEELNEAAIGDFLLFGLNCDSATTTYRDVRRLPAAHSLTISGDEFHLRRYWAPPTDGRIRYQHADDYIEHFKFLLQAAVKDRLRTERAGILLSGGLDSAAIATTAQSLSKESGAQLDLRAYTIVYESLIPDRDGVHAQQTAEFLKIPIRYLAMDDLLPFERWNDSDWVCPEPAEDPFYAGLFDQFRMISEDCRVVLSGEGSDNLMHFEMWPHVKDLSRRQNWTRLFAEVPQYLWRRPSPLPGLIRRIKGVFGRDRSAPAFPRWIAPEFARRTGLEHRWQETNNLHASDRHPIVPGAHASLALPNWANLFEQENAGVTRYPVEVRHPFLDLRVVNYLLALPPYPWFYEKTLLREAMAGRLPESVRRRPKTPLAGDPLAEWMKRPESNRMNVAAWSAEMDRFVNRDALSSLRGTGSIEEVSSSVRPVCLNFWLQSARRVRYNFSAEARNG
ncbi:MAG: asparagine synthetase B family protein [Candidatus Acidiferrales bacterium]